MTTETKTRKPRISAEEVIRRRENLLKAAELSIKIVPTIKEDLEWVLSYAPTGTRVGGGGRPAKPVEPHTEAGYQRHLADGRKRAALGLDPDEPHDTLWPATPSPEAKAAHEAHLENARNERARVKKARQQLEKKCRVWYRRNVSEVSDMLDEIDDTLVESNVISGLFEGYPTFGDNTSELPGTDIPTNVMLSYVVQKNDMAELKRGVWVATDYDDE